MDTWPAHATGMSGTRQVGLSKHKELVVVDEEKLGKPQMTPKPKFLHNLESVLKKELRTLGVTKVEPNELRLQVCFYCLNKYGIISTILLSNDVVCIIIESHSVVYICRIGATWCCLYYVGGHMVLFILCRGSLGVVYIM